MLSFSAASRDEPNEDGFTLVELLVALLLFAIVMAPLAEVFYSGLRTTSADQSRAGAILLGTRALEAMTALPYGELGYYPSQVGDVGYLSSWQGDPAVDFTAATAPSPLPVPTQPADPGYQITQGSTVFTIQHIVVWVSAVNRNTGATMPGAYKRAVVLVCWLNQPHAPLSACTSSTSGVVPVATGQQTVQQSSVVYPGSLGAYTTAQGVGG